MNISSLFLNHDFDFTTAITACLNYYNIPHNKRRVGNEVESHLYSPSIITIKDILYKYGVDSEGIRKGSYSYSDFEYPFICSIQDISWHREKFVFVDYVDKYNISYIDPEVGTSIKVPLKEFEEIDTGIIILLEKSKEFRGDLTTIRESKIDTQRILWYSLIIIIVSSILLTIYAAIFHPPRYFWINIFFLISSIIGASSSTLLLLYEIDKLNPFIKEVCGGTSKLNCSAVISSDSSKFLGIRWSIIGTGYFITSFITVFLFFQNIQIASVWSTLSILILPYVIYSLYYQKIIIRQWCRLCLIVQAVIICNALSSFVFLSLGTSLSLFEPYQFLSVSILIIAVILSLNYIFYIFQGAKDGYRYKKLWKRLRYNPDIFHLLLRKSKRVEFDPSKLGITIGNPNAEIELIKVCNPYCAPCSKAHKDLEQLLIKNGTIRIRTIFTASGEPDDAKNLPVLLFLETQKKMGQKALNKVLSDWYTSEKDFTAFSRKYPINLNIDNNLDDIKAMYTWCNKMKIRATPTLFINGNELPEDYRIDELEHIFGN